MDLFTLDRNFRKQEIIDQFSSAIWTERYFGDSEVQLVVPTSKQMTQRLWPGTFLGCEVSDEIMIIETQDFDEKGNLKVTGISLLSWLNNRFIRTSPNHEDRYWNMGPATPGQMLSDIVYYMCIGGGYLDGSIPTGIGTPSILKIPNLVIGDQYTSGPQVTVAVPFGPVYDALKALATTYNVGMQIRKNGAVVHGTPAYWIEFRTYKGLDRTSNQDLNPIIRFTPEMDSLTNIKEINSISGYKTLVYAFAPANPEGLATVPGQDARLSLDSEYSGFDMRALMIFAEDITTDMIGGDPNTLRTILNSRATDALSKSNVVKVVDGEIVPQMQFKYGLDYNLGDTIELQGNSGNLQNAQVTEYIFTQDSQGERAYPTVSIIS